MNKRIMLVVTALALCLGLTSCPEAEDAIKALATLRLPQMEPVSKLQSFTDAPGATNAIAVQNITEAMTLFTSTTSFLTGTAATALKAQDTAVYTARFNAIYDDQQVIDDALDLPSAIFKVDINDTQKLPSNTGVNHGSITGSSTFTVSTNTSRTLKDIQNKTDAVIWAAVDDMKTMAYKGTRTFAITDGFIQNGTLRVAGYITVEYTGSEKKTLTYLTNATTDRIFTNNISGEVKFSLTLVAVDTGTSRGAKFRLSGIRTNSGATTRTVSGSSNTVISNLEVCTNAGNSAFTFTENLPVDHQTAFNTATENWFTFAKEIIAKNTQNF